MATLLDRVFAPGGITARFQPVVDVSRNPVACTYLEGLVRGPAGTNLERADVLFSYIRRRRESARMDRLCVAAVLDAARALPADVAIGFNVDAATLTADAQFPEWVRTAAASRELALSRLVVEIVEHTWPWDLHTFHAATGALRDMGVRLALDDVGRAHSNYRLMLETRPDFFKIDRYFIAGAHADPMRREVMRSIAGLARSFGARVVAEGVEHAADLECVLGLGIELAQGYLLTPLLARYTRREEDEKRRETHVEEHGYR
jgi:EAL domain-containing protein (putative c-di-GMP-specific phosphodiesterase class I)